MNSFFRLLWLLRLKAQVHTSIYEEEKLSFIPTLRFYLVEKMRDSYIVVSLNTHRI